MAPRTREPRRAEDSRPGASGRASSAAQLWPNVGAEEGRTRWRAALRRPEVQALVGAWRELFGAHVAQDGDAAPRDPERADAAAFPCLEGARGLIAWLNTEQAEEEAQRRRLELWGPDPRVVEAVHDKGFALRTAIGGGWHPAALEGLCCVLEARDLQAPGFDARLADALSHWPAWTGRRFVLKPRRGTSGRGRVAGHERADARVLGALPRLARRGGCVLEPWLERTQDLSAQLWIPPEGGPPQILATTQQRVRRSGVYLGSCGVVDARRRIRSGSALDPQLRAAALGVAERAQSAGFAGACGVDALVFRPPGGETALRPVVEINARFTAGWVAAGLVQRALGAGRAGPGTRWSYTLGAARLELRNTPAL